MSDLSTLAEGLNLSEAQMNQLSANINTLKSSKLLELDADVARAQEGTMLTNAGRDLLAKAIAGKELQYTRCALGDSVKNGAIVEPTEEQMVAYTNLIHKRGPYLDIADLRFTGAGTATITCILDNRDLPTGFWAREIGIFAKDPDTQEEILYAYRNSGVLSKWIEASGGAVALTITFNLITVVDQATNVKAVVDASLLWVSHAELVAHINSTSPHPNTPQKASDLSSTEAIWATGSDEQLHKISTENLAVQMLGSSALELPQISTRLTQAEINLANLYMQSSTKDDLGLDANLLIAEDFSDSRFTDMTAIKVDALGTNSVNVGNISGVRVGHYLTISDKSKKQIVRVSSITKTGSVYTIYFESTLSYSFKLAKTYLYRTTGAAMGNVITGSADERETVYTFDLTWQGEASSSSQTLNLSTALKNKENLELSGDWSLDSNGYFTIA